MQTLFQGGKIIDGDGEPITDHGLLIEDDKIVRIAPVDEFAGFDGETVDTSGGTLLPGLIDCHVHLCLGAEADPGTACDKLTLPAVALQAMHRAQITLQGGVTAVRDCGGREYAELEVRDSIAAGRFLGPSIRASGRMICMTGGHGNRMGRIADGADEVIKAVRENVHRGVDVIKIMATGGVMTPGVNPEDAHYSPEELAAGIAEATRFHRTTASHAQGAMGILNAVRGGVTSIEHGIFMDQQCIDEMLAGGTYLVPTLSAVANILRYKDRGIPSWAVEKSARVFEVHIASFKAFYQAGGKIAMGTDAGTPFNAHGENAQELGYMVEHGMAPIDAIRSATAIAADLLRLEDSGRLLEGNRADLLVVDGDPTADISRVANCANHRMVLKGGKIGTNTARIAGPLGKFDVAAAF